MSDRMWTRKCIYVCLWVSMFICSYVCVFFDASLNGFMSSCVCPRHQSSSDRLRWRNCKTVPAASRWKGRGSGRKTRKGEEEKGRQRTASHLVMSLDDSLGLVWIFLQLLWARKVSSTAISLSILPSTHTDMHTHVLCVWAEFLMYLSECICYPDICIHLKKCCLHHKSYIL